ncbi:MAG: phosphoenolpyruvate carboxykinase (GTP), partial [Candidatus Krumholzibacteria bacterium]|nr:phosphoenolpyruvate carboxykinase (GTP) [Candidatus Krumholzibacteria bacterium]
MLELKKGIDILSEIGGVKSADQATSIFKEKMDDANFEKIQKITNPDVRLKIANAIAMCQPDSVFVNDGSEADKRWIRDLALEKGEEKKLAMKDHTIHYDLKDEQGRIVDRTFYIVNEGETISALAKKKLRHEALEDVKEKMTGVMKGMTMVVGFYMRGPIGAPVSNPALEITSSAYVCHSAELLYRNIFDDFEKEVDRLGHFFTNVHSEGPNRPEDLPNARVYMDRSWWTTFSVFCTYAGNTLLMKKGNHRFAVDKATYMGKGKEISEHMFITGLRGPGDRVTFFAGAAPSGCGKTTTAMVGTDFIGDDLAQIWIADDGTVRAINPEAGIFGIVQDVNVEGDPLLVKLLRNEGTEVIWSNVLIDDKLVPHWVGNEEEHPKKGFNFQGEWHEGKTDDNGKPIPLSHPNSRCTLRSSALATFSELSESGDGVLTRVITYSGRDSDTMPPVWVAKTPDHGVVIGASIVSAATATEVGATGVKRAPWANAPFIPGPLGDYMKVQFEFFNSDKIADDMRPIMAGLNYFLTHEARGGTEGKKLLGEKRDVKVWLGWLELLAHKEIDVIETPVGFIPKYEDLKGLFKS